MLSEVSDILGEFRKCFSRTASFNYFVVIVFGLIVRYDFHGVTSFIRCLGVWPDYYESVLALFRSNSFRLENINRCWIHIVKKHASFPTINGCWLFAGDGVKVPKEGRRMPGSKELHQESDNSGKPNRFCGHHFGVIGIIAGNARKMLCIPLMAEVQEGVKELRPLQGKTPPVVDGKEKVTVVTLMALLGCKAALYLNHPSMLILDAGYVSGEIFKMAMKFCESGKYLGIITRGKKTFVGFKERHVNDKKKSGFTSIEIFVNFSCIALGLLQILALAKPAAVWSQYSGWLRTVRSDIPSEETVRRTVQHSFFFDFGSFKHTLLYRVIGPKRRNGYLYEDRRIA